MFIHLESAGFFLFFPLTHTSEKASEEIAMKCDADI